MKQKLNVFWFRRDLRLDDNAGLYHCLRDGLPVLPVFIFDREILDKLDNTADQRVVFIYRAVSDLQEQLVQAGSSIDVLYGSPVKLFAHLIEAYPVAGVFTNHDYEPYARDRDVAVKKLLASKGISFHTYKDQVIFDGDEIVKNDGNPYTIFTPYGRAWKGRLSAFYLRSYPMKKYLSNLLQRDVVALPSLADIGFENIPTRFPSSAFPVDIIREYADKRDYPGIEGTSRLGVHLRFGTVSIRKLALLANGISETYLNELIWREFFQMILWHFPKVGMGHAFKEAYEWISWRNDAKEFERWCTGETGYPIVDAGMRELNATGFMHNRVRMITASFLSKHLLIDWRWGEAYFAEKLLDFDLASNNGGWQWAAGTGCDAAPYFRVFNPWLQTKKFDPGHVYIRQWVPEFDTLRYPSPIVEHEFARKRCLEAYKKALAR